MEGEAMNAKIKAQWVAALRSGRYTQGYGKLRSGGKYCCLGVLCALYNRRHKRPRWAIRDDTELPHPKVYSWAGLTNVASPHLRIQGRSLAEYNDGMDGPYFDGTTGRLTSPAR